MKKVKELLEKRIEELYAEIKLYQNAIQVLQEIDEEEEMKDTYE